MDCPGCRSKKIFQLKRKTSLGYKLYRCLDCRKDFNERTGTVFNHLRYPTDVVLLAVFFYYRYKLSLIDVTEHMSLRGFSISDETVRLWSQAIGSDIGVKFRNRRKGKCGKDWHMDSTYLRIEGRWCYLYRAIDKKGNLIDVYLSDTRDEKAARKFFKNCKETTCITPDRITTDKEKAFPKAIEKSLEKQ
jgi:transposase-like protein